MDEMDAEETDSKGRDCEGRASVKDKSSACRRHQIQTQNPIESPAHA
jgi:hypothetical protein